jgi:hypothetical protein
MTLPSTSPAGGSKHKRRKLSLKQTIENGVMAQYVAIVVRNTLQERQHFSDAQMNELLPIIRDAIYTAFDAFDRSEISQAASAWAYSHWRLRSFYPEDAELLKEYEEFLKSYKPERRKKKGAQA